MQVNRNVFGYEIYEAKKFIVETTKTVRGQMLLDTIASYTDNLDFAYDQVYTLYSTRLFVLTSAAVRDSFLHRRLRSASRARDCVAPSDVLSCLLELSPADFIRDPTSSTYCFRRLLKTYLFARY